MNRFDDVITTFKTSTYVSAEFISWEYIDKFNEAVALFKEEYSGVVSGLWVIAEPSDEGELMYILRTRLIADSEEYNELLDKLYDILGTSLFIDFDGEIAEDYGAAVINDDTLEHWLNDNLIFTIYDSERE